MAARNGPAKYWYVSLLNAGLMILILSCKQHEYSGQIDRATLDKWSAPYRGWHYYAEPIIPSDFRIQGFEDFHSFDVPTVYQIPGQQGNGL